MRFMQAVNLSWRYRHHMKRSAPSDSFDASISLAFFDITCNVARVKATRGLRMDGADEAQALRRRVGC
jgi:hypothetical protein